MNRGIDAALSAGAESVMLMNPDCVLDGAEAQQLFDQSESMGSIVAPIQVDLDSGTAFCAGAVPLLSLGFPTLFEPKKRGGLTDRFAIVAGGRGVVIPRSVFETIGKLAANDLPHYWADHDFYLRARRRGIAQHITDGVAVRVDQERTSSAADPRSLGWAGFRASLTEPRSHRNLPSIRAFFRRNYPIRPLHRIGTGLYLARYFASWAFRRLLSRGNL